MAYRSLTPSVNFGDYENGRGIAQISETMKMKSSETMKMEEYHLFHFHSSIFTVSELLLSLLFS